MSEQLQGIPVEEVLLDLQNKKRINIRLPQYRLLIDHPLPFIVLYRKPEMSLPDGIEQLVNTEASFLIAPESDNTVVKKNGIIHELAAWSLETFGVFAVIELFERAPSQEPIAPLWNELHAPALRMFSSQEHRISDTLIDRIIRKMGNTRISGLPLTIEIPEEQKNFPDRPDWFKRPIPNWYHICIEIEPCFRDPKSGIIFPRVLKALRTRLSRALRESLYHFIRQETTRRPKTFHVLGTKRPTGAVWQVDKALQDINSRFNFLLSINPVGSRSLWHNFKKSNFEIIPTFRYRPLALDTSLLKRALFQIPVERVEDPSLAHLFNEKQEELDRQITMLADRGSSKFLLGSHQLFGQITGSLVRSAEEILERVHERDGEEGECDGDGTRGEEKSTNANSPISTRKFMELITKELDWYKQQYPQMNTTVRHTEDLMVGLMVSNGELLLQPGFKTTARRADALIQHEIGTHMVTWANGAAQPLGQLRAGLASYEELQEGLAVMAEYLVGGLTPDRLRTLAARVLAAHSILDGATFVDTFRFLCRYGFQTKAAFSITLRIYRGGGYIKDCIYLRGFEKLLRFLQAGGDVKTLYTGKFALKHVDIVNELLEREVIIPPVLIPRYLREKAPLNRLENLRTIKSIYELTDN
ncbi:MAG: DUF1704 domain-containing protein [Deltaproteobacteria bacterium]|nr:DUF1704 domain-containing protein [Deltaproteobacteria bacterium]